MPIGDRDLGDRLRKYIITSQKTLPTIAEEMKFKHVKRRKNEPMGLSALCKWRSGNNPFTEDHKAVVKDYLTRMKA